MNVLQAKTLEVIDHKIVYRVIHTSSRVNVVVLSLCTVHSRHVTNQKILAFLLFATKSRVLMFKGELRISYSNNGDSL